MNKQKLSVTEIFNAMDAVYKTDRNTIVFLEREILAMLRFCISCKLESDLRVLHQVMDKLGFPSDTDGIRRVTNHFESSINIFKPFFMLKHKYDRDRYDLMTSMVDHLVGLATEDGEDVTYYMNISKQVRDVREAKNNGV